jgi:hypothetical protein
MKATKSNVLITSVLILVCACSPQRRLERLIARHPELCIRDTVCIRDSVILPAVMADTALAVASVVQPVIIHKDRLEIEVRKVHDTLYIRGECKADTVYRTLRMPVDRIKLVKEDKSALLIRRIPWLAVAVTVIAGLIIFLVQHFLPRRT